MFVYVGMEVLLLSGSLDVCDVSYNLTTTGHNVSHLIVANWMNRVWFLGGLGEIEYAPNVCRYQQEVCQRFEQCIMDMHGCWLSRDYRDYYFKFHPLYIPSLIYVAYLHSWLRIARMPLLLWQGYISLNNEGHQSIYVPAAGTESKGVSSLYMRIINHIYYDHLDKKKPLAFLFAA